MGCIRRWTTGSRSKGAAGGSTTGVSPLMIPPSEVLFHHLSSKWVWIALFIPFPAFIVTNFAVLLCHNFPPIVKATDSLRGILLSHYEIFYSKIKSIFGTSAPKALDSVVVTAAREQPDKEQ